MPTRHHRFFGTAGPFALDGGPAASFDGLTLTGWTKENLGARAILDDIAGYYAAVQGTTDNTCADRKDGYSMPDTVTVDFTINVTANWDGGVQIGLWCDADARTEGLINFAASGTEDGYTVEIEDTTVRIYRFTAGSRFLGYSQAITELSDAVHTVRIRALEAAGNKEFHVYIDDVEAGTGFTDETPPAGIGTGFLIGAEYVTTGNKSHLGPVDLYEDDLGAP